MSYYNNYPSYNDQGQRQATQNTSGQRQQFTNSGGGGAVAVVQYRGDAQHLQYAAWQYQQQQNLMRYPQQPPTYPPPNYSYPQYHHSSFAPSAPTGYYPYSPPPVPPAYHQAQGVAGPRSTSTIYSQPNSLSIPPPPLPARVEETQMHSSLKIPPVDSREEVEVKEVKTKQQIVVGKRRGGRVLPTGVVKKQRTDNPEQARKDPWSQYMNEVRRYKEQSCEDDRKNRPLVK